VKKYYEDDVINEAGKVETGLELAKFLGSGAKKAGKKLVSVPVEAFKKHTLRDVSKGIDFGKLTSYKNFKADPKGTLAKLKSKDAWKGKALQLKGELDKTRTRAKVGAAVLGTGMAANEIKDDFTNVKSVANAAKLGVGATVRLGAVDVPKASARVLSLMVQSAAATVGGIAAATAGFNAAVDSGRITGECLLHPSRCRASIVRAITNGASSVKAKAGSVASGIKNSSTTSKVATGAAVVGGTVLAAKLIKDALEKKDWYNNGCNKIEDPEKKSACLAHVGDKVRKELMAKMKRCKLANNPDKCTAAIRAKLNELG
jgi:hypothetical protein